MSCGQQLYYRFDLFKSHVTACCACYINYHPREIVSLGWFCSLSCLVYSCSVYYLAIGCYKDNLFPFAFFKLNPVVVACWCLNIIGILNDVLWVTALYSLLHNIGQLVYGNVPTCGSCG